MSNDVQEKPGPPDGQKPGYLTNRVAAITAPSIGGGTCFLQSRQTSASWTEGRRSTGSSSFF